MSIEQVAMVTHPFSRIYCHSTNPDEPHPCFCVGKKWGKKFSSCRKLVFSFFIKIISNDAICYSFIYGVYDYSFFYLTVILSIQAFLMTHFTILTWLPLLLYVFEILLQHCMYTQHLYFYVLENILSSYFPKSVSKHFPHPYFEGSWTLFHVILECKNTP